MKKKKGIIAFHLTLIGGNSYSEKYTHITENNFKKVSHLYQESLFTLTNKPGSKSMYIDMKRIIV